MYYNGSNLSLGSTGVPSTKLGIINNSETYALVAQTTKTGGNNYGIYSVTSGNTTGHSYGVLAFSSSSSGTNYGLYSSATANSTGTNYGLFAQAYNNGAGDAYAGYFNGNVRVTGVLNRKYDLTIAYDDGAEVAIGTSIDYNSKLKVYSDSDWYGINSNITSSINGRTGVYGSATGNTTGSSYGVRGYSGSATGNNFGISGTATISSSGNNYGVYGFGYNSGTGTAYAGFFNGDVRITTDLNQGADLRIAADDGAEVGIGTSVSPSVKLYVNTDSNTYSIYAQNNKTSGTRYSLYGTTSGDSTGNSYGVRGSSSRTTGSNYGVYGRAATASTGTNYGVYGSGYNTGSGSGYAGYFNGNVYVTGNMSAGSITDRTPYPKDLATAYNAVMSMERLGDDRYMENNKELQLDHSALSDFIRSEDGHRDLSATVSCLNEVVKDLIVKQKGLIKTNEQIDLLKEQLNAMQKENQELKTHLARIESMLANPMSELKGDF